MVLWILARMRSIGGNLFEHPYEGKKYRYWVSKYAMERVERDQNFILFIVGSPGTGKSFTALSLGMDIDPSFNIDRVTFSTRDFLRVIASEKPDLGKVVVYDESGVGIARREWYSREHKAINNVIQTFRKDNWVAIFTTPSMSFVDKNVKALVHGVGEMIDPVYCGGRFGFMKYKHIHANPSSGDIYEKFPRIKDERGVVHVLKPETRTGGNMFFHFPPKKIVEEYVAKSSIFKDNLKEEMFNLSEGVFEKKGLVFEDLIELFSNDPHRYRIDSKKKNNWVASIAYGILCIEYPDHKISRSDVRDAVLYIRDILPDKELHTKITDNDLLTIKRLMQFPFNWNIARVAKHYNCTDKTIWQHIDVWKKKGVFLKTNVQ